MNKLTIDDKGKWPLVFRVLVGGLTVLVVCRTKEIADIVKEVLEKKDLSRFSYE